MQVSSRILITQDVRQDLEKAHPITLPAATVLTGPGQEATLAADHQREYWVSSAHVASLNRLSKSNAWDFRLFFGNTLIQNKTFCKHA